MPIGSGSCQAGAFAHLKVHRLNGNKLLIILSYLRGPPNRSDDFPAQPLSLLGADVCIYLPPEINRPCIDLVQFQ